MKDEIHIHNCSTHEEICEIVEDWIDYYNNERYQWDLAKLSPSAFYEYTITGKYPITVWRAEITMPDSIPLRFISSGIVIISND